MIKWVSIFRKRPGMSDEDFLRHWREVHVPLVKKLPGLRKYVQSRTVKVVGGIPFDGLSEMWFDDLQAVQKLLGTPEWEQARKDAENFLDVESVTRILTEEYVAFG